MKIIDTHQHFWHYQPQRHEWINEAMAAIRRDFLPGDLAPVLQRNGVEGCIAVQADQTPDETAWLLSLGEKNDFIKGVVGWVDLCSDALPAQLEAYAGCPLLKGFRHVLQAEEPSFMLQPAFVRGVKALAGFGYTYDILVFPKHLDAVLNLLEQCPGQPFVMDHLAKPLIAAGEIDDWKRKMSLIASHQNVYCKVSGMVTEADWSHWNRDQLRPYLDAMVECFGMDRLLFGSDWPVCLVAATYERWLQTVKEYFSTFTAEEQARFFSKNAESFYRF